jgi:hypothetical protein
MIRSILATSRLDYPFPTKDVFTARMILTPDDGVAGAQVLEIVTDRGACGIGPKLRAAASRVAFLRIEQHHVCVRRRGAQLGRTGRAGRFVATPGFSE